MNDAVSLLMTMCSAVENLNLKFGTEVRTREQHFDIVDFFGDRAMLVNKIAREGRR